MKFAKSNNQYPDRKLATAGARLYCHLSYLTDIDDHLIRSLITEP